MIGRILRKARGFTLIEAVLVMIVVSIAFLGFGYLFGNLDQEALKADLTVLATKLAKEKVEEIFQEKADSGYAGITSESAATVNSGSWAFTRSIQVGYVNPADLSNAVSDTGYKKVTVDVAWGGGIGESISITTLVTDMVPSAVVGAP
jgi:prepilin-type N-terminal cleavage/methylation domain-containing protein